MRKPFYDMLASIDDASDLAIVFNRIISSLQTARMVSAPTIFRELDKEKETSIIHVFYESCLWEMYLHGVITRLHKWQDVLKEYFADFEGNWKYYASLKRIESINKYGGEDEDYNTDGSIRKTNISDKDLTCYTVISDLVQDDWRDIVQETKPNDLTGLCAALATTASTSITDIIKKTVGIDVPMYKEDESGNMVEMSFGERALSKAAIECQADDLSIFVLLVCRIIQHLIEKIKGLDKFKDNKNELTSIHKDIGHLLDLDLKEMSIWKEVM